LKASVRVFAARLTQHFENHVNDPGALGVNHFLKTGRRFGGSQTVAETNRTDVRRDQVRVRVFRFEFGAIAIEPDANPAVRSFLAVCKKQGHVAGDSLVNPLVAVARPADNISPPLMSRFVKRDKFIEVFLPFTGQADPLLRALRQKGIGREIEQAGPALAKASGNLRDSELLERERACISFVETNGRVDFTGKALQTIGGARLSGGDFHLRLRAGGAGGGPIFDEVLLPLVEAALCGPFPSSVRRKNH